MEKVKLMQKEKGHE
ncbi:TPA: hypothetical protein F6U29_01365 [Escherichia coli]|nr:hypothetical protein [Escherichia coli]